MGSCPGCGARNREEARYCVECGKALIEDTADETTARASGSVFISYRRRDSAGHAGRLYDRLAAQFGQDRVFMDVGVIEPGEDFRERIRGSIARSDLLLTVIGPNWDEATPDGVRRLDAPGDYVRAEIEAGLQQGLKVIPVLVEGATMPSEKSLPEPLQPLAFRQAVRLSDADWHTDVRTLLVSIEEWQHSMQEQTLTVTFVDLVGSSALGEHFDPDTLVAFIREAVETVKRTLEAHGGIITHYMGDSVAATFGLRGDQPDHVVRAARGALELSDALSDLRNRIAEKGGVPLQFRVGMSSGRTAARERTPEGISSSAISYIAARLEQAAAPDTILIDQASYDLAREALVAKTVEPVHIKRMGDPISAWRLLDVR